MDLRADLAQIEGAVKRRLTLGLLFAVLCDGETLRIRLYDLVHTSAGTLDHLTDTAGRVLAEAGVNVIWEKGAANAAEGRLTVWTPGHPPDTRGYLVARLLIGPPGDFSEAELGYALPFVSEGAHVTVYYDRVEKVFFATKGMPSIGSMLGAAMAHEIGHVLTGSAEHSPEGVMKGNWGVAEFRLLSCKRFHFTAENAAALRTAVAERFATGRTGTVLATCPSLERFNSASIKGFRNCN
jgi:hypothetical protein